MTKDTPAYALANCPASGIDTKEEYRAKIIRAIHSFKSTLGDTCRGVSVALLATGGMRTTPLESHWNRRSVQCFANEIDEYEQEVMGEGASNDWIKASVGAAVDGSLEGWFAIHTAAF